MEPGRHSLTRFLVFHSTANPIVSAHKLTYVLATTPSDIISQNNPYVLENYNSSSVLRTISNDNNIDLYFNITGDFLKNADVEDIISNYNYSIESGNLKEFTINNESVNAELIGYRMKKILNPETKQESTITLTSTSLTPRQSEIKFDVLMNQDISRMIKLNQENLLILRKELLVKCDKNGNERTMDGSIEYSDGSIYPNYYKVNVNVPVEIYKNGEIMTESSVDLSNTSYSRVNRNDSYVYKMNGDNEDNYYDFYVDEYHINTEKVYINHNVLNQTFFITNFVVIKNNIVESDSEGNTTKRYYYDNDTGDLKPIWEVSKPDDSNMRYADGDTEMNYYRIIVSDFKNKYTDSLIDSTSETNYGKVSDITKIIRTPVNNVFAKVSEIDSIFCRDDE